MWDSSTTKSTIQVVTPAHHLAVRQQGARVGEAKSNARCRRDARHINGGGGIGWGPAAVPELALAIGAPAFQSAAR